MNQLTPDYQWFQILKTVIKSTADQWFCRELRCDKIYPLITFNKRIFQKTIFATIRITGIQVYEYTWQVQQKKERQDFPPRD